MSRLLSGHYTFIERSGAMFHQLSWLEAPLEREEEVEDRPFYWVLWKKIDSGRV